MRLNEVLESLQNARPLSKGTLENYRRACAYFGNFLGREAETSDLSMRSVNAWLVNEEKQFDPKYVRSLRRDLLVVWNHAADIEECPHPKSRLIRIPAIVNKEPQAWPTHWVPRLIEAAENVKGNVRGTDCPRSLYASAYLRAQLELLCRPTDLRYLLWSNVQTDGTIEWVQHKTGRVQTVIVSRETLRAIYRLQGLDPHYVFPLRKTAHELLVLKIFNEAGIEKPKGESFGHFRHTGGTEIAKQAGNDAARKALGHTPDSKVFEKHYQDQRKSKPVNTQKWWETA